MISTEVTQSTSFNRWLPWAITGLAVAVYLSLALYQYRLPGLYYDEAADVVPAMQLLKGQPVSLHRDVGIHLFGRDFPVMIGDYWGVTSTYAVLPLFATFGFGVFPIRLWPIGACAVGVLLTFLFGRRLFNGWVGAAAALLLAVSPTYVFWSRVGIYVIAHIVAIALGVTLLYLSWRDHRSRWKLFALAFLAGVGLTTKLLFVWFFIAIPVAYVAMLLYDWVQARRPCGLIAYGGEHLTKYLPFRDLPDFVLLTAGFLIGAFPVIYYNVASRGSYYLLRSNFLSTEREVDNFAFAANFVSQLRELQVFLDGGFFWFLGGVYTNSLSTLTTGVATLGLILLTLLPEYRRYQRVVVFLLAYAFTIFILSCFSISILAATHLFILLPLPQLMIAACVVLGAKAVAVRLPNWRWAAAPAALGVLLLAGYLALDLRADVRYHRALARTGGLTAFSDSIYDLAKYLDETKHSDTYALDWGVKTNVIILTEGRVTPLEIFGLSTERGGQFDQAVEQALAEESPLFISQTEDSAAYPMLDRFQQVVEANNRQVILEEVFRHRDGTPAFYLFRVGELHGTATGQ